VDASMLPISTIRRRYRALIEAKPEGAHRHGVETRRDCPRRFVVAAGIVVPYINTGSYGERLRSSLERALGRRVEFRGRVRFSLFSGPGFSVDDVVIHEDPSIGLEPIAYMDTRRCGLCLWSWPGAVS